MDNSVTFSFPSRGKLDKFFLTVFKILPCHELFLVTTFLALLLECSAEIIEVFIKITLNHHRTRKLGDSNLVFYAGKEDKKEYIYLIRRFVV